MTNRIAYFERTADKVFRIAICAAPCNGEAYWTAPRIQVAGKAEARAYCKANGIKPWNF